MSLIRNCFDAPGKIVRGIVSFVNLVREKTICSTVFFFIRAVIRRVRRGNPFGELLPWYYVDKMGKSALYFQ